MDAVDTALVDFAGTLPRLVAASSTPWPAGLRERLAGVADGALLDASSFALLDSEIGAFFSDTIGQLLRTHTVGAERVRAIGCHGQTVAHLPHGTPATTLQLGDANIIAERTGITTVNDFRRRDMAAGGQGAPLAPAFHAAVLHDAGEERVVLNLGGIANITVLPADPNRPVIGFDTGPANCLMDLWVQEHIGLQYDRGGDWAASAAPLPELLAKLLEDPFLALPPPKSTGTQYFSRAWLDTRLAEEPEPEPARVQATLLAFTAQTITEAIKSHAPATQRVLACGGGAHNGHLIETLSSLLDLPVESTAAFGIEPDWMEAMAFAWLARQTLDGAAGNLPSVTGAVGARILGAIHPG